MWSVSLEGNEGDFIVYGFLVLEFRSFIVEGGVDIWILRDLNLEFIFGLDVNVR